MQESLEDFKTVDSIAFVQGNVLEDVIHKVINKSFEVLWEPNKWNFRIGKIVLQCGAIDALPEQKSTDCALYENAQSYIFM